MSTVELPADARPGRTGGSTEQAAHAPTEGAPERTHPIAWWGMVMLVTTEAMVFAALLSAYFFLHAVDHPWPPPGIEAPKFMPISLFSALLIGSSVPIVLAERFARRDRQAALRVALAVAFVMAGAFLANQAHEYTDLHFAVADNGYTSLFAVITGLHGLHVLGAVVMSAMVQAKAWTGRIRPDHDLTLRVFAIYWHFVDGVWVFVFASLYVSPHLGGR